MKSCTYPKEWMDTSLIFHWLIILCIIYLGNILVQEKHQRLSSKGKPGLIVIGK